MKIGKMKTKMSGKTNNQPTMTDLFNIQQTNQNMMLVSGMYADFKLQNTNSVPADDTKLMSYHIQQLISEIGEVLEADKRWKNFRNNKYDRESKLEEVADCFIVLMNVAMFSGFNGDELSDAIVKKLNEVRERLAKG